MSDSIFLVIPVDKRSESNAATDQWRDGEAPPRNACTTAAMTEQLSNNARKRGAFFNETPSRMPSGRSFLLRRVDKLTSPGPYRMHIHFPNPPAQQLERASQCGGPATCDPTFA